MPVRRDMAEGAVPEGSLDGLVGVRDSPPGHGLGHRFFGSIETRADLVSQEDAGAAFDVSLAQARAMRDAIAKLLGFLGELDELDAREADLSAFVEVAGIFDDICQAAEGGASVMRLAAARHPLVRLPGRERST
jgi:hypothetical protein